MWKPTTGTQEELLQKAEMTKFLFEQQTKETQSYKARNGEKCICNTPRGPCCYHEYLSKLVTNNK
jgi:hypothetical protein